MNTKMKIVTNLISTPLGSILEKSNSIAKAMDNYNKFSTVKTGDIIDGKKVCKCQSKYVKKIQNKNVHFIHLPFGKNL